MYIPPKEAMESIMTKESLLPPSTKEEQFLIRKRETRENPDIRKTEKQNLH